MKSLVVLTAVLLVETARAGGRAELPLSFEPSAARAEMVTRGRGFAVAIGPRAIAYFDKGAKRPITMLFCHASRNARLEAADRLPGISSYFLGPRSSWRTNIPQFGRVTARNIYAGIDVTYHGNPGRLEYDLIVAPGADPRRIQIAFPDTGALHVTGDGSLATSNGIVLQRGPIAYQNDGRGAVPVPAAFSLQRSNIVTFTLGPYNRAAPLVIDPIIVFATLLGGSGIDTAGDVALDSSGNIYVTGSTESIDLPKSAHFPSAPAQGKSDVFVTKLDASGKTILYSALIGGSDVDTAAALAVDAFGNAYVAGSTQSSNFPTTNCIGSSKTSAAGAFVFKLNSSGTALLYSTCLSSNDSAAANSIAVDAGGAVYIAGNVAGALPATSGAAQQQLPPPANGGIEVNGYLAKLDSGGKAFIYATYITGSQGAEAHAVALDAGGNAYVTGATSSTDFPARRAHFSSQMSAHWEKMPLSPR